MSSSNCPNKYVPEYVPQDLRRYERDGGMTWYDQIKCQEFLRNSDSDKHLKTAKNINFDIIRREAADQKVLDEVLQNTRPFKMKEPLNILKVTRANFFLPHSGLTDLKFFLKRR